MKVQFCSLDNAKENADELGGQRFTTGNSEVMEGWLVSLFKEQYRFVGDSIPEQLHLEPRGSSRKRKIHK